MTWGNLMEGSSAAQNGIGIQGTSQGRCVNCDRRVSSKVHVSLYLELDGLEVTSFVS